MDKLLRGEFEYDTPRLLFSQEKIYVSVSPGETFQGEVYLGSEDDRKIRGYVSSSDRRLIPGFNDFSGTTIRLPFGVDAVGMEPGEQRNEWLCFTTSIGEYRLPFVIETKKNTARTSSGEVCTCKELQKLAEQDFREAYRIFSSPAFRAGLTDLSGEQSAIYDALTVPPVTYQSLEEFLIAMKLKDKVTISLPEYERDVYEVKESISDSIHIKRSGWGYLRLEISTEGDFLTVEKRVLTDDDFIGTSCILNYIIHAEMLGKGRHFGKIRIQSPYQELVFEIEVSRGIKSGIDVRQTEKKRRFDLCGDYLDYRTGKTDLSAWAVSSRYELNRLKEAGCDYPEYLLYEAFVLITEGRTKDAAQVLNGFKDRSYVKDDIEIAGVYLYLCVLCGLYKDKEAALRRIQSFCHQKEDSLFLHLALVDFDPEYKLSAARTLNVFEDLFDRGIRSPIMYLEALERIRKDEGLLRHLNRFWIQVFLFGARRNYLTDELVMRFSYLCGYEKQYSECLYRALALAYEDHPLDDTLEAVCRLIMMDNPRRKEYFKWYSLALERGIRLTRLYEYYLETIDVSRRKRLPKPVLMYFNYNSSSLSEGRRAYLYASVTECRDADPESFEAYKETIAEFAREKLMEGKLSEDLVYLYSRFMPELCDRETAEATSALCFCRRLYCDAKEIRSIVVRHYELTSEQVYPVSKGAAYPCIYTDDAAVIFVDTRQRRFSATIDHSIQPLFDYSKLAPQLLAKGIRDAGLLLAYVKSHEITSGNLKYFREVTLSRAFTPEYRDKVRRRILTFYRTDPRGESLEIRKKQMDYREYAKADRQGMLSVLTMRGLYDDAYHIIEEFGTEGMELSALLRITGRKIIETDFEEDDEIVALASELYRSGTYDETVLDYLMLHRYGPVDELIKILKSATGFEMDTYAFEEKILEILMLTCDYRKEGESILEHYAKSAGKERVIGAYITLISYGYLVKDYSCTAYTRTLLEKAWRRKWPVDRICSYALLKMIVREKDPRGKYAAMKKELLAECREFDYCFSFFRRLPASLLAPYQLDDKTIVECHADPRSSVTLFYELTSDLGVGPVSRQKPVPMMYEGIYTSVFTLFYGDTLKYYFEIELDGKTKKTAERTIKMNQTGGEGSSRYQLINHLLASHRLSKDQETATGLRQYLRQQQYVDQMFVLSEEEI